MGIVWEAYHKGVPLLGVPGITLDPGVDDCILGGTPLYTKVTKSCRYQTCRVSLVPYRRLFLGGMGFPLHKPYPYSLYR